MQTIDQILPNSQRAVPQIYMYDDVAFPGWIKIGETTRADVTQRIDEQHPITEPYKTYHLLWHDNAFYADGSGESFSDHDLHECLRRMGKELIGEWCRCTLREAQAAYVAVRHRDTDIETVRDLDYEMRDEQEQAVRQTAEYFAKMDIEEPNRPSHYLWNAKMRFGKT
ncbi:MAG: GIY-YIG nuclease family protein, partial [Paludibacteraceae bacterium]|nr:GIY-YIG nuclease family protein [Paludibacteraceae bacterium]